MERGRESNIFYAFLGAIFGILGQSIYEIVLEIITSITLPLPSMAIKALGAIVAILILWIYGRYYVFKNFFKGQETSPKEIFVKPLNETKKEEKKDKIIIETTKVIHNELVNRIKFEFERIKDLDSKTINLISISGIVLGIVTGISKILTDTNSNQTISVNFFILLALEIIVLGFTLIFGLIAYRVRKYSVIPEPYYLIGRYEAEDELTVLRALNDEYAIAIEINMISNNQKIKYLKWGTYTLITCLFISPLLFVL